MKIQNLIIVALLLSAGILSGCANMSEGQQGATQGAAIGTVVGGLAGTVIGKKTDNPTTGTVIGAVAGGALGAIIGQRMNRQTEELEQVDGIDQVNYDPQKQEIQATLRILFDFDKYHVKDSEAAKLDQLAAVFVKYPENIVLLEGHTDDVGTESYNRQLSVDRAGAVERYLRYKNLGISSLSSSGYGEMRPVASNGTEAGRSQNRRVEIKISVDQSRVPQQ